MKPRGSLHSHGRPSAERPARLTFASPARRVMLAADPNLSALYRVRCQPPVPQVRVDDVRVTVQALKSSTPVESRMELALNPAVFWEIEFLAGIAGLKADLRELPLHSLDIIGGASQVSLNLAWPAGTVYLYIFGSIIQSAIRRPAGVGVRLRVNGSVHDLALDDQHFETVGGEAILDSAGFDRSAGRYEITITGSADRLSILEET
ncbi:MAG TPA: hypothetical protein VFF68_08570 [Anaerolineaceae bacterium]|nr:hypothetical protein [Anaerolineaceae bacterium]